MQDSSVFDKKEQETFNQVFQTIECWLDDYEEQFIQFTNRILGEFNINLRELKQLDRFGSLVCVLNQSFQFSVIQSESDLKEYFGNRAQLVGNVADRIKEAQESFKMYIKNVKQNYTPPSNEREKLKMILFELGGLEKKKEDVEAEYGKHLQKLTYSKSNRELITMNKLREIYQECERQAAQKRMDLEAQQYYLLREREREREREKEREIQRERERVRVIPRERQADQIRGDIQESRDHNDSRETEYFSNLEPRELGGYKSHSSQNQNQDYKQPDSQMFRNQNWSGPYEAQSGVYNAKVYNQFPNPSSNFMAQNYPFDQGQGFQAQRQEQSGLLQNPSRQPTEQQQGPRIPPQQDQPKSSTLQPHPIYQPQPLVQASIFPLKAGQGQIQGPMTLQANGQTTSNAGQSKIGWQVKQPQQQIQIRESNPANQLNLNLIPIQRQDQ